MASRPCLLHSCRARGGRCVSSDVLGLHRSERRWMALPMAVPRLCCPWWDMVDGQVLLAEDHRSVVATHKGTNVSGALWYRGEARALLAFMQGVVLFPAVLV